MIESIEFGLIVNLFGDLLVCFVGGIFRQDSMKMNLIENESRAMQKGFCLRIPSVIPGGIIMLNLLAFHEYCFIRYVHSINIGPSH